MDKVYYDTRHATYTWPKTYKNIICTNFKMHVYIHECIKYRISVVFGEKSWFFPCSRVLAQPARPPYTPRAMLHGRMLYPSPPVQGISFNGPLVANLPSKLRRNVSLQLPVPLTIVEDRSSLVTRVQGSPSVRLLVSPPDDVQHGCALQDHTRRNLLKQNYNPKSTQGKHRKQSIVHIYNQTLCAAKWGAGHSTDKLFDQNLKINKLGTSHHQVYTSLVFS